MADEGWPPSWMNVRRWLPTLNPIARVYRYKRQLDRDKDGIACEKL